MNRGPGISVIIPAYNYAHTLARAVGSVVPQLSGADELLIVDDGSTDDTVAVVEALRLEHPVCGVIHKPNGGAASARNVGLAEARCEWLVFLDADDELVSGALAEIRAHLLAFPDTRFVVGGHLSVEPDGRVREHLPQPLPETAYARVRGYLLDKTVALSNGACAMHRSLFDAGHYPESFRNAEDIPVFAQALAQAHATVLGAALAKVHKHDDSLRHRIHFSIEGGLALVEEVFRRLPAEMASLKGGYYQQRCLSLFRSAYTADDREAAKRFYRLAVASDWRTLFRLSYARKALRLWLGRR